MAAFMGTLNSYREICKEREIILREASVGVSLLAVVLSKAFVLLLIEDVQAAILTFGFVRIVNIPQNHLLLDMWRFLSRFCSCWWRPALSAC